MNHRSVIEVIRSIHTIPVACLRRGTRSAVAHPDERSELGDGRAGATQAACGRVSRGLSLKRPIACVVQESRRVALAVGSSSEIPVHGRLGPFAAGLSKSTKPSPVSSTRKRTDRTACCDNMSAVVLACGAEPCRPSLTPRATNDSELGDGRQGATRARSADGLSEVRALPLNEHNRPRLRDRLCTGARCRKLPK